MTLVELPVDAGDRLALSGPGWTRIRNLAARVVGRGEHPGDPHRRRAEPRRIDPVVHEPERRREREVALRPTLGRGDGGEVAVEHCCGRDERHDVGWRLRCVRALIGAEKEDLVLDNRSAQHATELVPHQTIAGALARSGADRGKRGGRVEAMVARELEHVTAEQVRACFGRDADRAARLDAVLRVLRAGLHTELLHRVGERQRQVDAVIPVVVHRAVQQILHTELLAAGDRDAAALGQTAARGVASIHRPTSQEDEGGHVAALERQRLDLLVVDDLSDGRVARLDERCGRCHGYRFPDRADLQRHGDHRIAVDLQHDTGAHIRAEAGECHFEAIRSRRQVGQCVRPCLIGHNLTAEAGVGLCSGDGRARQDAAARVRDGPVDLRRGLGPRRRDRD